MRSFSKYSDSELAKIISKKDKNAEFAFLEIYQRYASQVHSYCYRILNDEATAEDIFQETFIKFYQNIKPDNQITNIPAFLIKIARNLCLNHKRDTPQTLNIDDFEFSVEPNQDYEKKELLDLITLALDLLSFEFREAFILKEYDGLQYDEIANICGITVQNAKSRVFRAKQQIKKILAPYLKEFC